MLVISKRALAFTLIVMIACLWQSALGSVEAPRHGVRAIYRISQMDESEPVSLSLVRTAVSVVENRLRDMGFSYATVTEQGRDCIRVEIPDIQADDEILDRICAPQACLEIKDEMGNVLLVGKDIQKASPMHWPETDTYGVFFDLTPEGSDLFAEATAANLYRVLLIELSGEVISAPRVNSVIDFGSFIIENRDMTMEEAINLAMLVNSGSMSLNLERIDTEAIIITPDMGAASALTAADLLYQLLPLAIQLTLFLFVDAFIL